MTAPAHLQTAPAHPSATAYWPCIRPCSFILSLFTCHYLNIWFPLSFAYTQTLTRASSRTHTRNTHAHFQELNAVVEASGGDVNSSQHMEIGVASSPGDTISTPPTSQSSWKERANVRVCIRPFGHFVDIAIIAFVNACFRFLASVRAMTIDQW